MEGEKETKNMGEKMEKKGKETTATKRKAIIKHPGTLKVFGYQLHEPPADRRKALRKAVNKYGVMKVKAKLRGLKVLMKQKGNRMILARDLKYLDNRTGVKKGQDNGSAVITGVIVLIIFLVFVVAAVKIGLTFPTLISDLKTFFSGSFVLAKSIMLR